MIGAYRVLLLAAILASCSPDGGLTESDRRVCRAYFSLAHNSTDTLTIVRERSWCMHFLREPQ